MARSVRGSWELHRAQRAHLAGGSSTNSKTPRFDDAEPALVVRGKGCRVWDVDGNEYLDFRFGLGPVSLGYAVPEIDAAITAQLADGICFGHPHPLEGEVAALLCEAIPCAEKVRFLKTGGEAVAACIRIARAATGRDLVVHCGYNGWLSSLSRSRGAVPVAIASARPEKGVPRAIADLHVSLPWAETGEWDALFAARGSEIAAVVVACDYTGMEKARDFLPFLRALTLRHGSLLVLDEIVTGFRLALGGAQEYFGVLPDLAAVGKAMANGMPLSAYVGRADLVESAPGLGISSTFGGEALSLAAARAVLGFYREKGVIAHLWKTGTELWSRVRALIAEQGIGARIEGFPRLPLAGFRDRRPAQRVLPRVLPRRPIALRRLVRDLVAPARRRRGGAGSFPDRARRPVAAAALDPARPAARYWSAAGGRITPFIKRPERISVFVFGFSMVCHAVAFLMLLTPELSRPVRFLLEARVLLFLSAACSLAALLVAATGTFVAVHLSRALVLIVVELIVGPRGMVPIVLLLPFLLETSLYLPVRRVMVLNGLVIAANLALDAVRVVRDATMLDVLLLVFEHVLYVTTTVLWCQLISHRETIVTYYQRIENLSNANVAFQDHAEYIESESTMRERNRITRELHDITAYALTNIAMTMNAAKVLQAQNPGELPDLLETARQQAEDALQETRTTLYRLRSVEDRKQEGLHAFVNLARGFQTATGVEVRVNYGNTPFSLGREVDATIYRLIQQGLTNAFRHGAASQVRVNLWVADTEVRVNISDNGRGGGDVKEGIGLGGMRERLAAFGGRIETRGRADGFDLNAFIPREACDIDE